jgi:alpha-glucosidase (family GH31 glycosyl hydrolase)
MTGGNDPSFWFSVTRQSTGDVLFSSKNTHLVYEDQFIEFASSLPEDYNLYGLGERIHGLRLGNNLTATIFAADVGDPIVSVHRSQLTGYTNLVLGLQPLRQSSVLPRHPILRGRQLWHKEARQEIHSRQARLQ